MRLTVLLICAFVLMGGGVVSAAATVGNCSPKHSHESGDSSQPHKHVGIACFACCPGACTALPNLPPRTLASAAIVADATMRYWESRVALSGRAVAPDLDPPRSIA